MPFSSTLNGSPPPAVAVEAARRLGINRADAPAAIKALTAVLPRETLTPTAVQSLAQYGNKARRSIPAILRFAFPLDFFADTTLENIGEFNEGRRGSELTNAVRSP